MPGNTQRRLAAIVSADVVGYSRLMGVDEMATLDALRAHRAELIDGKIAEYAGRIVKTMGDGLLLEFANAVDAVRCALDIQEGMPARNQNIGADKKIIFRIGINFSEIILEDGDIFGDGVNIAARLEGLAEPGGVLMSQSVYDEVARDVGARFADNGNKTFKNIARPVHVWSWPRRLPDDRQDRKPFIVVSEFEGRSGDEKQLALDLREDLSAALSRLTGLEVTLDQRKADYLMQGGVRLAGGRCRISGQLITVADDKQLWAERYQVESGDSFDILDQCIPAMVMNIRRRIAADDGDKLSGKNLDDMTLEQLLSAAGVSFFTPTMQAWSEAGKIAERALQMEPNNFMALAMAAAGMGMAEQLYGFKPTDDTVISIALQRIEEARRQTSKSDMVLIVYGGLLLHGRKRYTEASAAAEASLQLNPDYNMALWILAEAKIFDGDYAAGIEAAIRAATMDIHDPYVHLYSRAAGYGYFAAREYDEAVNWFWKADQLAPGLPHNLTGLSASQYHAGDAQGARDNMARLRQEEPAFRLSDMVVPPFREGEVWDRFTNGLRSAGAPE